MRGAWRVRKFLGEQGQRWRLRRAMTSVRWFPIVRHKKPHGLDGRLVVTLTSYPPRFPTLGWTLRSLLDQSVRPDHIILWLTEHDLAQLPADVRALTDHGLELRTCPDLRSYKKADPGAGALARRVVRDRRRRRLLPTRLAGTAGRTGAPRHRSRHPGPPGAAGPFRATHALWVMDDGDAPAPRAVGGHTAVPDRGRRRPLSARLTCPPRDPSV